MSDLGLGEQDTRAAHRPVRRRRGHGVLAALIALVVVVALVGGLAYVGRNALRGLLPDGGPEDYAGPGSSSVVVRVSSGDSLSAIGGTLETVGVVASSESFLDAAADHPDATGIQPGTYELRLQMPAADALDVLVDPANRMVNHVVLPEGLRLGESLARIADGTGIPLEDLEAVAEAPDGIGLPDYADGHLEGFIFPATYDFEPGISAQETLAATVTRFNQAAQDVDLEAEAAALGRSPLEIVTVASIIEAETKRPEDMAKVARVVYNRLADRMLLQMDSTVAYAVGTTGEAFTTAEQRQTDSPYNTYRYPGLPPGPINSPGQAALEAALAPTAGQWRYFVAVNLDSGETRFAVTKAEHDANVLLLQEYCRSSDTC